MSFIRWSRARQMWLLVLLCPSLFAVVILFVPGMTRPIYWRVVASAVATM